ncbi:MAG: hypothetical protein ACLQVY_10750 [Limisphaerales bacterium]
MNLERQRHVESLNFSIVLEAFDAKAIAPEVLRQLCDTVQVLFLGYEHDTRSPFVIPEVRRFLRKLRGAWPCAPFFCDLNTSFVALEAFAYVDHARVVEKAGSEEIHFWICTSELRQYVAQSYQIIQVLGEHSGMSRTEIRQRKLRLADYITKHFGPSHKA